MSFELLAATHWRWADKIGKGLVNCLNWKNPAFLPQIHLNGCCDWTRMLICPWPRASTLTWLFVPHPTVPNILPSSHIRKIPLLTLKWITGLCPCVYFLAVIKARILSAHDKGTHAEVVVKVKKVLKSGKVKIARSNRSIYPESWTNRGCTCPILNPGKY